MKLEDINAFLRVSKDYDSPIITVYYQPETGTDNSYTFQGTDLSELLGRVRKAQINEDELNN